MYMYVCMCMCVCVCVYVCLYTVRSTLVVRRHESFFSLLHTGRTQRYGVDESHTGRTQRNGVDESHWQDTREMGLMSLVLFLSLASARSL